MGLKLDSIFAIVSMKVKSSPSIPDTRLISSTGVPDGMSCRESRTVSAGLVSRGALPNKRNKPSTKDFALFRSAQSTR